MEEQLSKVEVSQSDLARLLLLQRAWQHETTAQTIGRLLDEYASGAVPIEFFSRAVNIDIAGTEVPVHAYYEGVKVEGTFDRLTGRLQITSGELEGTSYRSPSGAAAAVVGVLNHGVHPNRNGWTFWTVTSTGHLLQSIRNTGPSGRKQ